MLQLLCRKRKLNHPVTPRRKEAAHALVHELLDQGHSRRAIARHLGWSLNTVLRHSRVPHRQDTLRENRPRPTRLDPYKPYLEQRFAAGRTNVTRLHRELLDQNAPLTYQTVRAYIATLRSAPATAPPPPPTVRQARCPELGAAAEHVHAFGEILTTASATHSPPGSTPASPASRFTCAVTAGLTLHWNSGDAEGAVNRIKKSKGSSTDVPDSNCSA